LKPPYDPGVSSVGIFCVDGESARIQSTRRVTRESVIYVSLSKYRWGSD
jgi:hypothetical protein